MKYYFIIPFFLRNKIFKLMSHNTITYKIQMK